MIGMFRPTLRVAAPGLGERVPQSILCCVFAFLDCNSHAALSGTGRPFRRAAQLPQSSCHDVTVDWGSTPWSISPATLASRPRIVRLLRVATPRFMTSMENWLALLPQLHTLQLSTPFYQSLSGLSRLGALRHLLLDAPSAYSLATALHGCGAQLRTLHLYAIDRILALESVVIEVPVAIASASGSATAAPSAETALVTAPHSVPDRIEPTSVGRQLDACTALESLVLHAKYEFRSDATVLLRAAHLPAMRSLSLIRGWCATAFVSGLANNTTLTSLVHHTAGPLERVISYDWPLLPCLRALDLGSSRGPFDYPAIQRAFPLLVRLRVVCDSPVELAGFRQLTDLTLLDGKAHDGSSSPFEYQVAVLLALLPVLQRFGIMRFRDMKSMPAHKWALHGVTHLALGLLPDCYPQIDAPVLRSLRANNMRAETLLQIATGCPLLERVELCGSPTHRKGMVAAARARLRGVTVVDCEAEFNLSGEFCAKTFAAADNWL